MTLSVEIPGAELPWSHIIEADKAGNEIETLTITPNAQQLKALAEHYDIDSIDNLSADLTLKRIRGGLVVHITGHFAADIQQQCVVSLEPIQTHIEEDFEAWYGDTDQAVSFTKAKQQKEMQKQHGEAPIVPEQDDPEPIIDGKLDLGDIVMQFVSLAIDPYPTKQGIELGEGEVPAVREPAPERKNPFAKLQEWKDKQGKE
ncbi:MAG: hypothetical protein CMH27_00225 [Micavibrio sp.]|nr:hypothetical protein [Micavibrio sp.]|tara:strand:- start:811 stop:1416 length:606 start_codon:yes stop_codon:yes gene_type:complete